MGLLCGNKKEENCKFGNSDEKCNIFDSYEKISLLKKTELIIELFRIRWGKWTVRIINWGLVVIFIAAIVDYFMSNKNLSIELKIFGALQIWVSFALGIIAMLFSIISMYLSFYNLELQKEADKGNRETLEKIKKSIVEEVTNEVHKKLNEIEKEMLSNFNIIQKKVEERNNHESTDEIRLTNLGTEKTWADLFEK